MNERDRGRLFDGTLRETCRSWLFLRHRLCKHTDTRSSMRGCYRWAYDVIRPRGLTPPFAILQVRSIHYRSTSIWLLIPHPPPYFHLPSLAALNLSLLYLLAAVACTSLDVHPERGKGVEQQR